MYFMLIVWLNGSNYRKKRLLVVLNVHYVDNHGKNKTHEKYFKIDGSKIKERRGKSVSLIFILLVYFIQIIIQSILNSKSSLSPSGAPMLRTFLKEFYSENDLDSFFQILPTAPKMTTVRVNTLKCTREEAKKLLESYFAANNESFTVLESEDFSDLLLIPSIEVPSASIIPSAKGK